MNPWIREELEYDYWARESYLEELRTEHADPWWNVVPGEDPLSPFLFNGLETVGGFYRVYLSLEVEGRYLPFESLYIGGSYQTI